jgi:hypothetical protein
MLPLALLATLALASDAHAAKPESKGKDTPAQLHSLVELELHDVASATTRTLLVPEHGELHGWIELFGSARPCRAAEGSESVKLSSERRPPGSLQTPFRGSNLPTRIEVRTARVVCVDEVDSHPSGRRSRPCRGRVYVRLRGSKKQPWKVSGIG